MKKVITSLFIYTTFLFLSCNYEMQDGIYTAKSKNKIDANIERLGKFNKNDFERLSLLNNEKSEGFNELITNEIYHSETDLGTCEVNACIVHVKNKRISKIIYLTCNNVQLLIFEKEKFQNSILLNDKGIEKIDKLFE